MELFVWGWIIGVVAMGLALLLQDYLDGRRHH